MFYFTNDKRICVTSITVRQHDTTYEEINEQVHSNKTNHSDEVTKLINISQVFSMNRISVYANMHLVHY